MDDARWGRGDGGREVVRSLAALGVVGLVFAACGAPELTFRDDAPTSTTESTNHHHLSFLAHDCHASQCGHVINGYDDIDLTLQHEDDIRAYERMRAERFPFKPRTLPARHMPEEPVTSARESQIDWPGPLADRGII